VVDRGGLQAAEFVEAEDGVEDFGGGHEEEREAVLF
jgi:hypothetical protein